MTMMAAFAMQAVAQSASQATAQAATGNQTAAVKRVIVVSLEDRKLALVEDGKVIKIYPVAVGKPSTPSPVGTFTIERRVMNPTYSHDGRIVLPGPNNPVGTRWMGLSIRGYGIHGTNVPSSIGKAASHGCIRMAKADLEELYPMVAEGDTVELIGERNEETAQLFGGDRFQSYCAAGHANRCRFCCTSASRAAGARAAADQLRLRATTALQSASHRGRLHACRLHVKEVCDESACARDLGFEAALLPVAAALLLEELTYGGLVRLLLAPRPETDKRKEPNHRNGGGKCSH